MAIQPTFAERLLDLIDGLPDPPKRADLFRIPITTLPSYFLRYEGRGGRLDSTRYGIVLLHHLETQGNMYSSLEELVNRVHEAIRESDFALEIDIRGLSDERLISARAAGGIVIVQDVCR